MPVMSGFYTQRGLPAICPPSVRTRQALNCGCDVVLELPFTFACAPSSRFAEGAVSELVASGVVTDIAFGVDTDDTELLRLLSSQGFEDDVYFNNRLNGFLSEGISFPKARAEAIKAYAASKNIRGDLDSVLSGPNSILALDYLTALKKYDRKNRINVIMIKREGAGYHDADITAGYASATAIRKVITSETASGFSRSAIASKLNGTMPDIALGVMLSSASSGIFTFPDYTEYIKDCMLKLGSTPDLENTAYMSDDLCGYLKNFGSGIRPGSIPDDDYSLKIFEGSISTRRYTLSRIQRALASMINGQDRSLLDIKRAPYIRVLGFNSEGKYCLKIMSKCAKVPMITRPSDCLELCSENEPLKKIFELDMRAAATGWKLFGKDIASEWKACPVIIK